MAEAATIPTTTPKQIGKQLRAVRRRKGLSLSEVARGAGLSRRELVAYERGKVPIPESDLWVLAGSCGVDVNELLPDHESLAIEAGPSSIGDTIEFLRRGQQNGTNGRQARALEAAAEPRVYSAPTPAPVPQPVFEREPAAPWTPGPSPARPVDVFEELARLPDPVPLNPDPDDYPDFLAPPAFLDSDPSPDAALDAIAPPPGTFELVDNEPFKIREPSEFVPDVPLDDSIAPGTPAVDIPAVVEPTPDVTDRPWTPADAPPIDVALRGETYTEQIGEEEIDAFESTARFDPETIESGSAQPDWASATSGVWNEPDDTPVETWSNDTAATDDSSWNSVDVLDPSLTDTDSGPSELMPAAELLEPPRAHPEVWTHEPDPEATNTGFLVDWGGPEPAAPFGIPPAEPGAGERILESRRVEPQPVALDDVDEHDETTADAQPWEPRAFEQRVFEPAPFEPAFEPAEPESTRHDTLMPISWHPEFAKFAPLAPDESAAPVEVPVATVSVAEEIHDENWPDENWVVADDDWELGNALPLVEVRGQGALVMRRADERWALASLRVSDRYVMEVDLKFRSGPGFGVLFRADVDDEGRLSAYSFDVDPVYEGGAYLVRQWRADRELWNPIAHVPAADPTAMYGDLIVRLVVDDERLVASVNNVEVMTVEDLNQCSTDRGRDAATGKRVGVQAWSSSDLVVETLRVTDR